MIILAGLLNIAIPLVLLVQVVVALLLILVVLMQRPKQEGLGATFGGGVTDQMFGAQTTNVLQKATVWFGIIFFSSTLLLAILYNKKNTSSEISTGAEVTEEVVAEAPKAEDGELSLAEQLTQAEEAQAGSSAEASTDGANAITDGKQKAIDGAGKAAGAVGDGAKAVGEGAKNLGDGALDAVKKAGEAVGDGAKAVGEGAKKVLEEVKE